MLTFYGWLIWPFFIDQLHLDNGSLIQIFLLQLTIIFRFKWCSHSHLGYIIMTQYGFIHVPSANSGHLWHIKYPHWCKQLSKVVISDSFNCNCIHRKLLKFRDPYDAKMVSELCLCCTLQQALLYIFSHYSKPYEAKHLLSFSIY